MNEQLVPDSLSTRADVARFLGISTKRLQFLLYRLPAGRKYRRFELKKRSGGVRVISAPILPFKRAQARIAELLGTQYKPRSCVFGYVKRRSIQMNADCHIAKRWVLRVDLKDFFPSINFGRIRGVLLAPPFSLAAEAATTIAQICCHHNELPQGSPASPIISNIMCRGLDHALLALSRQQRCSYTRYCDDLIFSTNRRVFPVALAVNELDGTTYSTRLGERLHNAIAAAGFRVNELKVQLRPSSQRQMVTGLITNQKVNVPRQLVRDLRNILFAWRKYGHDATAAWYFAKYDKKNRPPGKKSPAFKYIVRGKLQYLGAVRGWQDPTYVALGRSLSLLDPSFRLTTKATKFTATPAANRVLHMFVEGPTDKKHIETALGAMQAKGRYSDLRVQIDSKDRGSAELLKLCKSFSERLQSPPCVFLFDTDESAIVPHVVDSVGDVKDWGNGVFSSVLAHPAHRDSGSPLCIELLYKDADLQQVDGAGRKLFLASEFRQPSGRHKSLDAYWTTPKKGALVIEDGVFDFTEKKICLSKAAFATLIQKEAATVDFDGFAPLMDHLVAIRNRIGGMG